MRKAIYFTTFSAANWNEYARYTLPTWERLASEVIIFWDNSDQPESMQEFLASNGHWCRLEFIGAAALDFQSSITPEIAARAFNSKGQYRYRRDIRKFAWPVFAFAKGVRRCSPGACIWLDADVEVRKPIPYDAIFKVPGEQIAYLGRTHHPVEHPYTESGLIGWRLEQVDAAIWADAMEFFLASGRIYQYDQWHDCIVFDEVLKDLAQQLGADVTFNSISRDPAVDHVFDDTLSDWLWHYRGPHRKRDAWEIETRAIQP